MDNVIKVKFDYKGQIPFASISNSILCIPDALKHANRKLLQRTANQYRANTLSSAEFSVFVESFDSYYQPEILIETAFLGSWGLTGSVIGGIFGAFLFFGVQETATYDAIKEEAHEQIHEFTLDMCEYIEENKQGLEGFSVRVYAITDGLCVEFKEALSEKIFDSEQIFQIEYILKSGYGENDPEDVNSLRRVLSELGYDVNINGAFDVALELTVRDFQRSANITTDGKVGPITINALKAAIISAINDR